MNIKTQKPMLENRDTKEQISALCAYIENIKTEIAMNLEILSKKIDTVTKIITASKGEET